MFVLGSDETVREAIVQRALAMPARAVETLIERPADVNAAIEKFISSPPA
jgi:hypothetical protein